MFVIRERIYGHSVYSQMPREISLQILTTEQKKNKLKSLINQTGAVAQNDISCFFLHLQNDVMKSLVNSDASIAT